MIVAGSSRVKQPTRTDPYACEGREAYQRGASLRWAFRIRPGGVACSLDLSASRSKCFRLWCG